MVSDMPHYFALLRSLDLYGLLLSLEHTCLSSLQAFADARMLHGIASASPIFKVILPTSEAYFKWHLLRVSITTPRQK